MFREGRWQFFKDVCFETDKSLKPQKKETFEELIDEYPVTEEVLEEKEAGEKRQTMAT